MIRAEQPPQIEATERASLRRRVKQMYERFNQGLWDTCFELLDPKLREKANVESFAYVDSLRSFKNCYGAITPWYIRLSLHLDASANKFDDRPFAYVYVIWQDERHGFHMFKERWVKESGHWFSRVAGLVTNQA